ncbi:MAG: methionine--tRNA ligase, partial [Hyphomicrobiales bacterium]|nr:methionine--tRNA ligase [Hyphomicrobiales bacterium]
TLRAVAIVAQAFIPASAGKLLELLGVGEEHRQLADIGSARRIEAGTSLPAPSPIFPRFVDTEINSAAS